MLKTILRYGLIGGVVVAVLMVAHIQLLKAGIIDFDMAEVAGYLGMLVAFSSIFFGIKNYRDKSPGGTITFGRAFLLGLGITFIAGVLYTGTWMVYSATAGAGFEEHYAEHMAEKMKAEHVDPKIIAAKKAETEHWMELSKNPLIKMAICFMEIFPVGLLVSLIAAIIFAVTSRIKTKKQAAGQVG